MPGLATLTIARYEPRQVRTLLARVPIERRRLASVPGLAWARHLGTSAGQATKGRDLTRWAWFCVWDDPDAADHLARQITARTGPAELATIRLATVRSRGSWAGRTLDGGGEGPGPAGPIAVLTRARVRPAAWRAFSAAAEGADASRSDADGLVLSLGMGEWPVLVQATFSVWRDPAAIAAFNRSPAHADAVRRTAAERWYAEELFARFSIVGADGDLDGRPVADVL